MAVGFALALIQGDTARSPLLSSDGRSGAETPTRPAIQSSPATMRNGRPVWLDRGVQQNVGAHCLSPHEVGEPERIHRS
jgi:hypothetical protein